MQMVEETEGTSGVVFAYLVTAVGGCRLRYSCCTPPTGCARCIPKLCLIRPHLASHTTCVSAPHQTPPSAMSPSCCCSWRLLPQRRCCSRVCPAAACRAPRGCECVVGCLRCHLWSVCCVCADTAQLGSSEAAGRRHLGPVCGGPGSERGPSTGSGRAQGRRAGGEWSGEERNRAAVMSRWSARHSSRCTCSTCSICHSSTCRRHGVQAKVSCGAVCWTSQLSAAAAAA